MTQRRLFSINKKQIKGENMFNAIKTKDECVLWIREFFEKNGTDCNVVIGISGGKDSSVVAALCAEALGIKRVIGVLMPNGIQSDIDAAQLLVDFLGIRHYTVNIRDSVEGLKKCSLSEECVGYATRYGDGAGDFSPCCRLTVHEVKAIGRVLGLPEKLIEKPPVDGLSGKTDEENLGFTYEELDRYIRTGIIDDPQIKQRIDLLHAQTSLSCSLCRHSIRKSK